MRLTIIEIRVALAIAVGLCVSGGRVAQAEDTPMPAAPRTTPRELTPDEEAILKTLVLNTTAVPEEGTPPLTVSFAAEPLGGDVPVNPKYVWDFADGSKKGRGQKVTHVFKKPGDYKVTVNVTDDGGMSGSDWIQISVEAPEKK